MTIWKFPLVVTDAQSIDAPSGAVPLSVQIQNGEPCIWMLCDPLATKTRHRIFIHGTGHRLPDESTAERFVGTFQMLGGQLVFHCFYAGEL